MSAIWVVGELAGGRPTRLTLELATLASGLARAAGGDARVVLVGEGAAGAATEVSTHGPDAWSLEAAGICEAATVATLVARLAADAAPDAILVGASPWGRDVAGLLVGLSDLPVLVNAQSVAWTADGPQVTMSTFGGRVITRSKFTAGRGIVVVRPGASVAEAAPAPGRVEALDTMVDTQLPLPRLVEQRAGTAASESIEEARIIVGAGRGVGGPGGLALVARLAAALGGVVGGTRVAVDSGWLDYALQIGQTGKIVRPDLYVACGISGAIQHKVGVQGAGTVVSVNRDPDAPIGEFADLVVVGDLFAVVPLLAEAIERQRAAEG